MTMPGATGSETIRVATVMEDIGALQALMFLVWRDCGPVLRTAKKLRSTAARNLGLGEPRLEEIAIHWDRHRGRLP